MVKLRKDDLVAHSRGYKSFRESFLEQERERTLEDVSFREIQIKMVIFV